MALPLPLIQFLCKLFTLRFIILNSELTSSNHLYFKNLFVLRLGLSGGVRVMNGNAAIVTGVAFDNLEVSE